MARVEAKAYRDNREEAAQLAASFRIAMSLHGPTRTTGDVSFCAAVRGTADIQTGRRPIRFPPSPPHTHIDEKPDQQSALPGKAKKKTRGAKATGLKSAAAA